MARSRRQRLPSEDQVWERVRKFAQQRAEDREGVPTLQDGVLNWITSVHDKRIERESQKGRTNKTPIRRGELLKVWRDLVANGHTRKARPNYFTLALLQASLADVIDDLGDGTIALRGRAPAPSTMTPGTFSYAQAASEARRSDGRRRGSVARDELRESDEHWRIKHYIHAHPERALAKLDGGPWRSAALELQLRVPTCDRVDVVVRDGAGYRALIEVKPRVGSKSFELYAQAAKYRAIWQVLHDLEIHQVRCVLAAPAIPAALARHMYERHRVESVAVEVPDDFSAPARDE